jgi:hypothetical protein
MKVNGDHRIHLVNDHSCPFSDVCRGGEDGGVMYTSGVCTNLEASLTDKVLIWINCWNLPSPTPAPPVQSDLVIWVIGDLVIDDLNYRLT